MSLHEAIRNQLSQKISFCDKNYITIAKLARVELPISETNINTEDADGNTPLHTAIMVGWRTSDYVTMYAILRTLLAAGANIQVKNKSGYTTIDLMKHIIDTSEDEDNNSPYLKYRDHVRYRLDIGVMRQVLHDLFGVRY
jgi:ankyrin repeat protein